MEIEDAVNIENLSKTYTDGNTTNVILNNASFKINKGSHLALIGRSGLGKSTLMRIIGCLERADSGRVLINGKDLMTLPSRSLAEVRRKSIGFVFQQFNLIPRLSVQKNLELPLIFAGIRKSARQRKITEILNNLGLAQKSSKQIIASLSGGEKQRVAIARALINDPEIILADEPTGSLDEENEQIILEILESINRDFGVTLLLITHNPSVAARAQAKITLSNGKIILCDEARCKDVFRSDVPSFN